MAGEPSNTITTDTVAKLLMITPRRVEQLAKSGALPRVGPSQFALVAAVQGYIKFLGQKAGPADVSRRVAVATLAAHLDLSRQRCGQFVSDGVFERDAAGRYDLAACRVAYIRYLRSLRSEPVETDAMRRAREARARLLELKALQQEGRLCDVEEMQAFVDMALGGVRAKWTPSRPASAIAAILLAVVVLRPWSTRRSPRPSPI